MNNPDFEFTPTSYSEIPSDQARTTTNGCIDEQMRLLVRQLGELVGRDLATREHEGPQS